MKKRWIRSAIAGAGLLTTSLTSPTHAQEVEEATFVIPTVSLTFTAAYIAQDMGLWEKNGLKVKTLQILGVGALNAVISGSAEFTHNTGGSMTRAAAKGQRLLAIANTIDRPLIELIIDKDIAKAAKFDPKAPLSERAKVLRGKTFAAGGVNSILHGFLKITAIAGGLDPEVDIRMAPMQASSVFPAFQGKTIDGFALSQPFTTQAVLDGNAVVVASALAGDFPEFTPFGYNLLITRPEVCEKRRSLCKKMARSFVEAIAFAHDHPKETLALLKKRFPKIDDRLLGKSFETILAASPRRPVVTREGLENSEIYNIKAGFMKASEKLTSYDGLYTDAFVR